LGGRNFQPTTCNLRLIHCKSLWKARHPLGFLGCLADSLAGLFHLCLEGGAGFLPGFLLERHVTPALAFTGVLAGIFPAPALAFASVVPFAGVRFRRGAIAGSGAGIVPAFTLSLAGIEAATDVLVLQQQLRVMFVGALSRAAGDRRAQEHAAKSRHGQFSKVAPRQGCISNLFSIVHVSVWFLG
jgi:hypothetical protein